MYNVNYHWDPLQVCVVGKCYPPEFYKFIGDTQVRTAMEKIAIETTIDLENLCKVLQSFGVEILRPEVSDDFERYKVGDRYLPAPITPRDDMAMIGQTFYMTTPSLHAKWNQLRGVDWPLFPPQTNNDYDNLPLFVKTELDQFGITDILGIYYKDYSCYKNIESRIKSQGNPIIYDQNIDSAMVCRLGKDLFFGTWTIGQSHDDLYNKIKILFPSYNSSIIESGGHLDGTICPVCPELVISSSDISSEVLQKHFPKSEIFYVEKFQANDRFTVLKKQNNGKWWLPGEENNHKFTDYVKTYFEHWLGNVEETSIDVNMLMIDPKNVICSRYNDLLFKKLDQYGITAHLVPFRHSNFWDGGLHCVTNDLHRNSND